MTTPLLTRLAELPPGGLPPEALRVDALPPAADISATARQRLDAKWEEYLTDARAHDKTLFNAPILALEQAHFTGETLQLALAPTDFRTFLVTALRDRPWFVAHAPQDIREALGNSTLLTHRGTALLGVRSHNVAAYPARAHLLGGVLEPCAGVTCVETLLAHLRKELAEEAHLCPGDLAPQPRLRALVRDSFLGQPELIWTWETRMPLEQVALRLHPHEHAAAQLLTRDALPPDLPHPLTPVAAEAWRLWSTGG